MKSLLLFVAVLTWSHAEAASLFQRDGAQDTSATYLVGEVEVAPRFLTERFGVPEKGDELRVSGSYTFKSASGKIFTLYEYKSTTVWATDEGLPTPEAFWRETKAQTLSIGSRGNDPTEFKNWILQEYRLWLRQLRK
jgi:hypothetical protein